ncbi:uncharacterized protein LOC134280272 isoform X3 [Saccostrea cucullata]|uniref:uncharacterized protein LOC134280272 isoform X3 n=1 Tax=Saccostrea cuccullata TaxID=36930 RepID=UPI002ED3A280
MIICSVLFSHVFFRFSAISIPVRISLRKRNGERDDVSVEEMVRDRLVCLLYSTKEQDIGTYQEIGEGQTCSFALIYQGPGHRNMSAVMKFNRLRLGYIYQTYRVVL